MSPSSVDLWVILSNFNHTDPPPKELYNEATPKMIMLQSCQQYKSLHKHVYSESKLSRAFFWVEQKENLTKSDKIVTSIQNN